MQTDQRNMTDFARLVPPSSPLAWMLASTREEREREKQLALKGKIHSKTSTAAVLGVNKHFHKRV